MNTQSVDEKIAFARAKTKAVTYHLDEVIRIHENNAYVVYSKTISGQLQTSYAAHAFTTLQNTLINYELVSICRLWDAADPAKENILTIAGLLKNEDVILKLVNAERSNWPSRIDQKYAEERANGMDAKIRQTLASIDAINASQQLASMMNIRDKHLAHSLEVTHREKKSGPVAPLRYGDETKILDQTIPIVEHLYQSINQTGYSFDDGRTYSKRHAAAFWKGIKVSALE